jgi:O-acetyl-ADP-ribose deacetylase (regulator of RNase III)
MESAINGRRLRLAQGDITDSEVDAIVNAANEALAPGGGVCGAIYRRGGPDIFREVAARGGCATGDAVGTNAGDLAARHVIHAVAPRWQGGMRGEADLLASAYRRSLEVADELGDRSVAFPSLGTGIFGYPIDEAAPIALSTVRDYLRGPTQIDEVSFVLFTRDDLATYERALAQLI